MPIAELKVPPDFLDSLVNFWSLGCQGFGHTVIKPNVMVKEQASQKFFKVSVQFDNTVTLHWRITLKLDVIEHKAR